jgi:tRNA G10  N-methylase Trm11
VVTDLPYGRFLKQDEANVRAILTRTVGQAPLGIFITEQDISSWLLEAGYREINVYRLRKRIGLTRYIHRARVR